MPPQIAKWCTGSLKSLVAYSCPVLIFIVQMTCEYAAFYCGPMWPISCTCHFIIGNVSAAERAGDHDH